MDKIIPSSLKLESSGQVSLSLLPASFKDGEIALIQKTFSPGLYLVTFRDGVQVKVKGPEGLENETPVRVFSPSSSASRIALEGNVISAWLLESEAELVLTAFLPLAFGGRNAGAKIEVFNPKEKGTLSKKKAVYFVITFTTERFGDLQWSIHLWGNHSEVQLFGGDKNKETELRELVENVEKSLRDKGFKLSGTISRLKKPFRVPQGFRLDWKA